MGLLDDIATGVLAGKRFKDIGTTLQKVLQKYKDQPKVEYNKYSCC